MTRIKRSNISRKKKKKYFEFCKNCKNSNSKLYIFAKEQKIQSLFYAYIHRKIKRKNLKKFFIQRLNSLLKNKKLSIGFFLGKIKKLQIFLNKKIFSIVSYYDTVFLYFFITNFIF